MVSREDTCNLLRAGLASVLTFAAIMLGACGGGSDTPDAQSAPNRRAVAAFEQRARPAVANTPGVRLSRPLAAGDPSVDALDAASQLMDFGEAAFPVYFPGKQPNRIVNNWVYRYYPLTQAYLAVIDGRILVLGGPFGPDVRDVGAVIDYITPRRTRPTANAGNDRSANAGSVVALDGSGSSDPNGDPLTYRWTLTTRPGTSRATLTAATSPRPSFTADVTGAYAAQLIVNDGKLDSVADTIAVVANPPNTAPVANAGANQSVLLNTPVNLDGTASRDADGNALTYRWTITSAPPGSATTLSLAATVRPQFTPDVLGSYVLRLVVNDGQVDSAPAFVTVTALAAGSAPIANAGPDRETTMGVAVELDGSASRDGDGDPLTYQWDVVESPSTPPGSFTLSGTNTARAGLTSTVAGRFVFRLTVSDGKLSATDQVVVNVVNRHLTLDGTDDYAVENEEFSGLMSTLDVSTFTVEAWIYAERDQDMFISSDSAYVFRFVSDASTRGIHGGIFVNADITSGFDSRSAANRLNTWIHVSFSYSASTNTCRQSVNGTLQFANTCLPPGQLPLTGADILFGIGTGKAIGKVDRTFSSFQIFKGAIDEVRLSNIVRYTANFTPARALTADSSTLGLWHFDEPPGATRFDDASGNGRHLIGMNGATTAAGTR